MEEEIAVNDINPEIKSENKKNDKIVVGFWFRLLSDALDGIILGILGYILTMVPWLRNYFYKLGEGGFWVGAIIAFLYTGILQSNIGEGQSLAKKMLRIQVVKMDGSYLNLFESFLRYTVILMIMYNSWIGLGLITTFPSLNNALFITIYNYLIFFMIAGTLIILPLHPLKRGLHDLLAKSIVIKQGKYNAEKITEINNSHKVKRAYMIFGSFVMIVIFYHIAFKGIPVISPSGKSDKLLEQIKLNTSLKNVSYIPMTISTPFEKQPEGEGNKKSQYNVYIIRAFLEESKFYNPTAMIEEREKALKVVIETVGNISNYDYILIKIRTGFNIGIARSLPAEGHFYTPDGREAKTLPFPNYLQPFRQ